MLDPSILVGPHAHAATLGQVSPLMLDALDPVQLAAEAETRAQDACRGNRDVVRFGLLLKSSRSRPSNHTFALRTTLGNASCDRCGDIDPRVDLRYSPIATISSAANSTPNVVC